jgi:hypothetical protein
MVSATQTVQQYELWLIVPGQYSEPLGDCGLYESQQEAERVASVVRNWLHIGVWCSILDYLDPEAQDALLFVRRGFAAMGIDLASVAVEVREFATAGHDNRDSTKADDWMQRDDLSLEDTTLVPPEVTCHTVGE